MSKPVAIITTKLFNPEAFAQTQDEQVLLAIEKALKNEDIPFVDQIGEKLRYMQHNYITRSACVQIIMTPNLLQSSAACAFVDLALDIRDDLRTKGKDIRLLVIHGIQCDWDKRFTFLNPSLNGVPWPIDPNGYKAYADLSEGGKLRQLARFSQDMKELYESITKE